MESDTKSHNFFHPPAKSGYDGAKICRPFSGRAITLMEKKYTYLLHLISWRMRLLECSLL